MTTKIDHNELYRLPWSYPDNALSWLEPTTRCNLRCRGCYRRTRDGEHKSLEEVRADLETFKRYRKTDSISITGGDPLVHPDPVAIVRMVKEMGWKPILNTNGVALTEPLLRELKAAGLFGLTFHVDVTQSGQRRGVTATTEVELNELRLHYANLVDKVGGIACAFNATISEQTLHEIPALVRFAQEHASVVHSMIFILYRSPTLSGDFAFYANGEEVSWGDTYEEYDSGGDRPVMSQDAQDRIREADPLYAPNAYLNGTANPASFKWLMGMRVIMGRKVMGWMPPKFMELVQTTKHFFTGSYLSYGSPRQLRMGKLAALLAALIPGGSGKTARRILLHTLRNPLNLFRRARMQAMMIIQPVTIEDDGRQDMCDACPDITVHEGKLLWSCRLEEVRRFGQFVEAIPRSRLRAGEAVLSGSLKR